MLTSGLAYKKLSSLQRSVDIKQNMHWNASVHCIHACVCKNQIIHWALKSKEKDGISKSVIAGRFVE